MMSFARWLGLRAVFAVAFSVSVWAQPVTLKPFNPTGIYACGEKAGWTVTLPEGAAAARGGHAYVLKTNNAEVVKSGPLEFTAGAGTIEIVLNEPAMLYLEVTDASATEVPQVAGAAVAPTELQPTAPRPADFDAFWEAKLELLGKIAPEPKLTAGESGKEGVEYATLTLRNINGATVYGQLAKPAREGKFPAMLILQWAGGPYPLQKSWVTERAAEGWLAVNIEPHDVPGDMPAEFYAALPRLIKNYNSIYNDDRDRNYFLQMYLGAYRAADYLASRPDWDGKVFVATGTSMGGQQSFAVAGLHPKITHMIVHVPAGADVQAALHGRHAGYPNWDRTKPKVMETALYFDTVNFASRIRATCLVSMGFLDNVTPPAGIWTAYNLIPGPKEVVPLPEAAHNHQATPEQQKAYTDRAAEWLAQLVREGEVTVAERNFARARLKTAAR